MDNAKEDSCRQGAYILAGRGPETTDVINKQIIHCIRGGDRIEKYQECGGGTVRQFRNDCQIRPR